MTRTAFLAVLVVAACGGGGSTKPPPTVGNSSDDPAPPAPGPGPVTGTLRDDAGQPLIGATVVLVGGELTNELIALSDDNGHYEFAAIDPGAYEIVIYYADLSVRRRFTTEGPTTIDQAVRTTGPGTGETLICRDATAASCGR